MLSIVSKTFCNHSICLIFFFTWSPSNCSGKDKTWALFSAAKKYGQRRYKKGRYKETITDWMEYLRSWSVAKYDRWTGLHQRWLKQYLDNQISVCPFDIARITWPGFSYVKNIPDCKNVWLNSSSESGQEQVLVGVWFRSSAVWDNKIQLIRTFLAAGQRHSTKLLAAVWFQP